MYQQKTVLLGSGGRLVLRVAFTLIVFKGSFTTSSDTSDFDNLVAFPNCTGSTSRIGDTHCLYLNNNAECAYDGGDCCECTCFTTSVGSACSYFNCRDPKAGYPEMGCEVLSPCVAGMPQSFVVESTADASSLADSIFCSGGTFVVEWTGHVFVNRTLYVVDGTVLDVIGAYDAVADGGGSAQLFVVINGTLRVNDVKMSNGFGIHGGAISATRQSKVTLSRVNLTDNIADEFGGAIHLGSSSLHLVNSSTFSGNGAAYGGAIYMAEDSSLTPHVADAEKYRFIDNNATDGGALYVFKASIISVPQRTSSTSISSNVLSFRESARTQYTSDIDYAEDSYLTIGGSIAFASFINNTAQSSGGAIYMISGSEMSWKVETIFEGNSAENGGALFVEGSSNTIRWREPTLFTNNRAREDGGAVLLNSAYYDSSVTVGCALRFLNNTCGGSGGGLALFGDADFNWGIMTTEFSGNSAALFGGAIYVTDAQDGFLISHARFTENQAKNGGAVFVTGWTPITSYFLGDSATELTYNDGVTKNYVVNFSSCAFVENSAVDTGGAIEIVLGWVKVENTAFIGNIATEGGALTLFGAAELFNCSFFDNHSGEGGGAAISNLGIISEMIGLSFSANYFVCAATEYVDSTKGKTRFPAICQGCDSPCQGCTIEDNTSVPTCTTMFPNAHSAYGTATIEKVILDRGYWRASARSTNVLSCYHPEACLGGLTGYPGYCRDGYEGPYCSVCSQGYATMLAKTCSKCNDGNGALLFVALAIAVLAALAFLWHMMSIEQEGGTQGVVVRVWKVLPLHAIKIVTVAWQIVTQFSSVAHVIYPDTYQRLLDVVALANFDIGWTLSAGCIIDVDFHYGLLVATIGPIVVLALLGITYQVAIHRNRGSEVAVGAVRRKHLGTAVLFTFFIYSSVSSAVFRTFACDELDDGSVYLRTDYRIECNSSRHRAFKVYAGFMIIVYPVGIPLFYTIILLQGHNSLQAFDTETRRYDSTSMLRGPYRPSVFYYEVVECSRRVLLTGVVVFIYPDTAAQIAVTIVIAFAFVVVSEGLSPFASRWDSWVSRAGHVVVFLSVYVALLLRVDVSNERHRDQNGFALVLVGAHAIMILLVVAETIALLYSIRS